LPTGFCTTRDASRTHEHILMSQSTVQPTAARLSRPLFFLGISTLILALVVLGFIPTFYLRPVFWSPTLAHGPTLPTHLLVHGIILTSWFLLLVIQSSLVATHHIQLHRRLGIVGVALAPVVVGLSVAATISRDAPVFDQLSRARPLPNLAGLIAFAICVVLALRLRRQPAAHKRLMIVGSLSILTPATDRLARWITSATSLDIGAGTAAVGGAGIVLLLLLALFAYDVRTTKRVHRGTLLGVSAILIGIVSSIALIQTGTWAAIMRAVM